MKTECENCAGLGHTDSGTTICPRCLDTGFVTPQLTAAVEALRPYFKSSEASAVIANYRAAKADILRRFA